MLLLSLALILFLNLPSAQWQTDLIICVERRYSRLFSINSIHPFIFFSLSRFLPVFCICPKKECWAETMFRYQKSDCNLLNWCVIKYNRKAATQFRKPSPATKHRAYVNFLRQRSCLRHFFDFLLSQAPFCIQYILITIASFRLFIIWSANHLSNSLCEQLFKPFIKRASRMDLRSSYCIIDRWTLFLRTVCFHEILFFSRLLSYWTRFNQWISLNCDKASSICDICGVLRHFRFFVRFSLIFGYRLASTWSQSPKTNIQRKKR